MVQVGEIEGWPVLYNPEKQRLFCKNTSISLDIIEQMLKSPLSRERNEEKNLTVIKMNNVVHLSCLTTTTANISNIRKSIKDYERNRKK